MKIQEYITKVLEFRWHIILGLAFLFLGLTFAYMYANTYYLHNEENIKTAAEGKQRVLLDLKTGELVPEFEDAIAKKETEKIKKKINKAKVSIVISDLGVNEKHTDIAMGFPKETNLSFNPYSPNTLKLSQRADEMGHLIIAGLPMDRGEAEGTPVGVLELNEDYNEFRNIQNVEATTTKVFSPKAVLMPEKEIFSHSDQIGPVVNELARKNLAVIYMGSNKEKLARVSNEGGNKLIIADVTINDLISEKEILSKLKDLENIARDKGYAILVIKSYPITLDIVKKWIDILPQKDIELTPLRVH